MFAHGLWSWHYPVRGRYGKKVLNVLLDPHVGICDPGFRYIDDVVRGKEERFFDAFGNWHQEIQGASHHFIILASATNENNARDLSRIEKPS